MLRDVRECMNLYPEDSTQAYVSIDSLPSPNLFFLFFRAFTNTSSELCSASLSHWKTSI